MKEITIIKNDKIDFQAVQHFDKIIISPGPKIPSESGQIIELIKRFAPTKCMLGICLGHQAIAEAFGGSLYQLMHPQHGASTQLQFLKPHAIFDNIAANITVGLYHSWAVEAQTLPSDLIVTSVNNNGVIMSIKHVAYNIHGVQFHPESYITSQGKNIIQNWLDSTSIN
jgi:anthranilate synthase component II